MHDSFKNLGIGLLFAAMFVYLLTVVNYQKLGIPFTPLTKADTVAPWNM